MQLLGGKRLEGSVALGEEAGKCPPPPTDTLGEKQEASGGGLTTDHTVHAHFTNGTNSYRKFPCIKSPSRSYFTLFGLLPH